MPLARDASCLPKTPPRCLAKALYDNIADTPDELAFRRGDVLTVLEQNSAGAAGWWLCSLRGRQGICPGNRLRLLAGVYDTGGAPPSPPPTPTPTPQSACSTRQHTPGAPHSLHSLYRGHARRKSWSTQPSKVILPQRVGDLYIYEQPQAISPHPAMETYDVPRPPVLAVSPSPRLPVPNTMPAQDWYDVPRAIPCHPHLQQHQLTPSSSNSSLTMDSMSSSNRSSLSNVPDYDIPRSRGSNITLCPVSIRHPSPSPSLTPSAMSSHSIHSNTYDVPPQNPQLKELPLHWAEALDMLEKLQSETTGAISKLLSFVKPGWRSYINLNKQLLDVRVCALRLRAAVHDLAEFTEGTMGNAASAHDKGLLVKLRPLVKALRDADRLVNNAINSLDTLNWNVDSLSKPDDKEETGNIVVPDALDQLIACARTLTEDVRQAASFIQGNSTLLFKKSKSLQMQNNMGEWLEENDDYVKLESRESIAKKHAEIKESLPNELKKNFEIVLRDADYSTTSLNFANMAPNDKQLVTYYAKQTITYFNHLTTAIDAFLQTVERNQPPAIFLAHGKFVVLNAHRLVYIGDTVHRNVENTDFKIKILACSNNLCDSLASTVTKTKNAAANYPSVSAVQDMVDAVVDVSNSARDLKICMVQAANQP